MLLWDPSDWPKSCLGFGILGDGDKRVPEVMAEEMSDITCCQPSVWQPGKGKSPGKQGKMPVLVELWGIETGSFPPHISQSVPCPSPGLVAAPPSHPMYTPAVTLSPPTQDVSTSTCHLPGAVKALQDH